MRPGASLSGYRVVYAVLLVAACLLAAAGCGSASKRRARAPADPGAAVVRTAVNAAVRHDDALLWSLLSPQTQKRVGPRLAAFRRRAAPALRLRLAAFGTRYRVVVSERLTDAFGVVGITSGTRALALPLRRVHAHWRVELRGPVRVRALGPRPGVRQAEVHQIAAAADRLRGSGYATMWLDGLPLDTKLARLGNGLTMYVNLPARVPRGVHTVVAFASARRDASALAWTFSSTR